jgi:hypothetical protein
MHPGKWSPLLDLDIADKFIGILEPNGTSADYGVLSGEHYVRIVQHK